MLTAQHPTAINHRRTSITLLTSLLKTRLKQANTMSRGKGLPPQSQRAIEIKAGRMNSLFRTTAKEGFVCEPRNFFYTFPYHLTSV